MVDCLAAKQGKEGIRVSSNANLLDNLEARNGVVFDGATASVASIVSVTAIIAESRS